MDMLPQLFFIGLLVGMGYLIGSRFRWIAASIHMTQPVPMNDQPNVRWKRVLLLAFGQKKMFKNPLVAILHLFVYVGFIIINIELLEIIVDGLTGSHRAFAPLLGEYYDLLINCFEVLAGLVLFAVIIFFIRRNFLTIVESHIFNAFNN